MAIIGRNTDCSGSGVMHATIFTCKFTAPESGNLEEIFIKTVVHTTNGNLRLAVYNDNAGSPGALRAVSSEIFINASTTWFSGTISTTVIGGTAYHLGVHIDGTLSSEYFREAGAANQLYLDTSSPAYPDWEDPLATGTQFALEMSIYAPIVPAVEGPSVILLGDGLT